MGDCWQGLLCGARWWPEVKLGPRCAPHPPPPALRSTPLTAPARSTPPAWLATCVAGWVPASHVRSLCEELSDTLRRGIAARSPLISPRPEGGRLGQAPAIKKASRALSEMGFLGQRRTIARRARRQSPSHHPSPLKTAQRDCVACQGITDTCSFTRREPCRLAGAARFFCREQKPEKQRASLGARSRERAPRGRRGARPPPPSGRSKEGGRRASAPRPLRLKGNRGRGVPPIGGRGLSRRPARHK